MPIMDEENVRFNTKCISCGRAFSPLNYVLFEDLRRDLDKAGWVRAYGRVVCKKDADRVVEWRDGAKPVLRVILRKRKRRAVQP